MAEEQKSQFSQREEEVLKFWEKKKIFQKSVDQRPRSKKFIFFEGPPTANGKPGIHHVLSRSYKDIICRYKTMRGYRVERKAGWDTHGLPVELQVEKELKISSKPEIEKYGIEAFNKKCKESVWYYKDEWERMTRRMAFWVDLKHPYITYSNEYIESVWWILSEINKKGLLYEGHKVVPYCSRCGTGLSSHEVAQGYKKIRDNSIYVRFKVKAKLGTGMAIFNEQGEILLGKRLKTGQWTLPGGRTEAGETYEQTIIREAKEETGLDVEIVKTLGLAESVIEGEFWRYQNFAGKVKGGALQDEKGKIEGWQWFPLDKLPERIYEPSEKTIKLLMADREGKESDVLVRENEETYFLVWTTTPWTLPGNVALAVGKKIDYVKVSLIDNENNSENTEKNLDNEHLILAKDRVQSVLGENYKILEEYKGKDLLGLEYEQMFGFVKPEKPAFRVVGGAFVTTQDGSGIVHIAPAFGVDDMNVAQDNDLPVMITVGVEGKFNAEITPWAGKYVVREETNKEIIKELENRKLMLKSEVVEHDYPFCWRCGTKLIYYAKRSWFIRMTDPAINKNLIKNNERVNWIPEYIKEGRMGEWLREVKDWALSRERYWGTPLPVWKCQCGEMKVIGSVAELQKMGKKKLKDLHRPYIDEITFTCPKCEGKMERVKDVIDCWFDSGAMPFAQWHYPFENKRFIDKKERFPADYISEAIDQTRGWFYTLLAISTLLGKGPAYKNVITYGHILDAKGQKMSKSKGNVVDPWLVADKYGIDLLRWYFYTVGAPGEPKRFDFKDMEEIRNKFFRTYWNSYLFYKTYIQGSKTDDLAKKGKKAIKEDLLDTWIRLRLNETIVSATRYLDEYDVIKAARLIGDFADDLSNWYIRLSRDRMRSGDKAAIETLRTVLMELVKLTAPFVPFISEEVYQGIRGKKDDESVHLEYWPKFSKNGARLKSRDKGIMNDMPKVRIIVNLGLAARAKAKIKVRQPLASLQVQNFAFSLKDSEQLEELIKKELNVKEIVFKDEVEEEVGKAVETDGAITVALDTVITDELREEGIFREFIRQVQEMRKTSKYTIKDLAIMHYNTDNAVLRKILENKAQAIKQKTILKSMELVSLANDSDYDVFKEINVEGAKIKIGLKKA